MTINQSAFLARVAALFVVLVTALSTATAMERKGDGKDHPLLSRMPGFEVWEKSDRFDAVVLQDFEVQGKMPEGTAFPLSYEGRVTAIQYGDEAQKTSELMIYRNYLAAVRKLGGKQMNTGFAPDDVRLGHHVFEIAQPGDKPPVHVLLLINSPQWYRLTIIQPQEMEQVVQAGVLAEELKTRGFATLHIHFETNKADLQEDGHKAVEQIVALTKDDPALKLSVEGHTDNVGNAAANRKLSAERASAVARAVVARGIPTARLSSQGFGAEMPVADNRLEDGRAKNRRVELVKKP